MMEGPDSKRDLAADGGQLLIPHRLYDADDPYASTYSLPNPSDSTVPLTSADAENIRTADAMPGHRSAYSNIDDGTPYREPAYANSQWLEKQQASNRRSKFVVIGSIVALLVLVAVGVVVGILVTRSHSSSSSSKSGSKSGSTSEGVAVGPYGVVKQTNPDDPSTFIKDPNLLHSFYGIAYTPDNSQLPDCGNSLAAVIEDIQLMSQLTTRIHLYGADCNQSALVLEAVKQTKVNMTIWLANYNVATNSTPYVQQRDYIMDAIKTYGTTNIGGVAVGNEFILDYMGAHEGGTNPDGPVGDQGAQLLIANITDTRNTLKAAGYDLPVGTGDAGAYFNTEVLEAVDFGFSNVHPWFANVSIAQAAGWTYNFFEDINVDAAQNVSNQPTMYIGETGWPTNSTDESNLSNGPSIASAPNMQTFLNDFVCGSNTNGTKYFYFEFGDELWQALQFGGVEGSWGLFYGNRTMKPITIPNCTLS
ncbi:glycoside hydrolase family 17 protein [Postia placenta MAD-698-R-SB12]|uniref:glucan endo-1,3-beta-D-glucosidase n=1 Tax=Postia placenta MAD-698-R-SB12 TaxID=670580 RepID=A0A1X6MME4_9APHY|nr:glycoside hydrolase family 17 protein [Postia placenta MAD-698-R-SB12]OSX57601.1 glycoside hydrolase family 17 protein [Postia placenta MAD-698-R-SB12]